MPTSRLILLALLTSLAASCSRDPEIAKREYLASGDKFFAEGKVKEALIQYRNAVRQDSKFGEARYKLAEAHARDGDLPRAVREYVRAADLLPKDPQAQLKAGRFLLLSRQFEDAKTRAYHALALDRRNVEAQILLGNALAGLKDLDGAIEEIQEALRLDPSSTLGYISLGGLEQATGKRDEAEAAFKKAVETDATSLVAHLALANFYWNARKAPETAAALQRAYTLEPEHPLINRMLALFKIASGKPGDAEPYLKKLVEVSKDTSAKIVLADYYVASGRSKDALPLLEEIASDKGARSAAELRLAGLALREGRRDEGQRRLDELLKRNPENASALLMQAGLLSREGKLDEAIARLQAAVVADPRSAEVQFALGRAYLAKKDPEQANKAFNETLRINPRAVAAQVELSRLALAGRRLDSSLQLAEQALKNAPGNPEARLALVRSLLARRDIPRADGELQTLLKQYPKSAAVQTQAGIVLGMKGDRPGAARSLLRALELDEDDLEALAALVSLDLSQKQHASAISRVDRRLERTPQSVPVLLLAANTYAAADELQKAEQSLRKVIEIDASNIQAYGLLSRMYFAQRRLDDALTELDALVKRQPRPIQAHTHTLAGAILEAQNKPQEARKRYEQALALDPEMPVAANNLAWMYVETGENLDIALQLAQAATRRLPDDPDIQDTLGWIYYKKGLTSLAIPALRRSVEQRPNNPIYHFHLGLAYIKAGDSPNGRIALQHALKLAPDFAGASEAKHVLASLKG